ncbi:hypothetical protein TNCV_3758411 [Trichonephila clavipes]|nr:hypothetical protein TNCV_3758411 [Trichonephila clavipes]
MHISYGKIGKQLTFGDQWLTSRNSSTLSEWCMKQRIPTPRHNFHVNAIPSTLMDCTNDSQIDLQEF